MTTLLAPETKQITASLAVRVVSPILSDSRIEFVNWALTDEGLDPETHLFEISDKKRTSTRLSTEGAEEEKTEKSEEKTTENEKMDVAAISAVNEAKCDKIPEKLESKKPVEEKKETPKPKDVKNEKENIAETDNVQKAAKTNIIAKKAAVEEENDGHESPIRLTLDDETLHDVESETAADEKSTIEKETGKSNEMERTFELWTLIQEMSCRIAQGTKKLYGVCPYSVIQVLLTFTIKISLEDEEQEQKKIQ
ncbi:hypothetical protein NQ317_013177 [Molorchus minor]|uniref:Uncharacterized protein n=1 Tax=Molorchus minor TaxID=1323400 RepID=A0ABQ9J9E6_9CUCU|nr:hypothetical protein NQ317_013177 [Molorchus minor]